MSHINLGRFQKTDIFSKVLLKPISVILFRNRLMSQKHRKGDCKGVKFKNSPGRAYLRIPKKACAFDARSF